MVEFTDAMKAEIAKIYDEHQAGVAAARAEFDKIQEEYVAAQRELTLSYDRLSTALNEAVERIIDEAKQAAEPTTPPETARYLDALRTEDSRAEINRQAQARKDAGEGTDRLAQSRKVMAAQVAQANARTSR